MSWCMAAGRWWCLPSNRTRLGALATLGLRRTAPGGRYGTVELAADGQVRGFLARSPESDGPINGGI